MAIITQRNGTLEYLTAEGIAVPHCFTTRLGGVSSGYLSTLNLGANRGDDIRNVTENFAILGNALGFSPESLVLTHQTHSDIVRTVCREDHISLDHRDYPESDAIISNHAGTALVVFTADCTPILLWDRETCAVGAIHAGWRGTAANIAGKTIAKMAAEFGCDPKNIHAAIGPNLGSCCFETDADVPEALIATYGDAVLPHIRRQGEKFYPDLKAISAMALRRAGVAHTEISTHCTMCMHEKYWSHRYTRGQRGSQGAIILCKEVHR